MLVRLQSGEFCLTRAEFQTISERLPSLRVRLRDIAGMNHKSSLVKQLGEHLPRLP